MNKPIEILEDFIKSLSTSHEDGVEDLLKIDTVPTAKAVVEIEVEPDSVHLKEKEEMEKAITTRTFPTLPNTVRRSVYASATTPVTRQFSKLNSPEGKAPLLPQPSNIVHDDYVNCSAHGLTYKSTSGCPHCAFSKSYSCKSCGGDLAKQIGGTTMCKKCGT